MSVSVVNPSPSATAAATSTGVRRRRAAYRRAPDERVNRITSIPFIAVHFLPLLAIFVGVTVEAVVLCVVTYLVRMFFITAGYHRYFAHRAYRMARLPQFLMAFGGTMAAQKGPLWWAGHHRDHHRTSDTPEDIHSPLRGFWWSHVGWILCDKYADTPVDRIRDFARFPELRFLNRFDWIGPWALGIACYLIAGWSGLLIGFFLSTVLLWHGVFVINSLAHVMGRRRYATEDTSRNSAVLAAVTLGEGWHNNHHYYQASARQGFFWWEFDATYYVLRALSWVGIVRDLKVPTERIRSSNRIDNGAFDIGTFRAHMARAGAAVSATGSDLGQRLSTSGHHVAEALADRRAAMGDTLAQRKEVLEEFVRTSLESAEELAKASRIDHRRLGVVGD